MRCAWWVLVAIGCGSAKAPVESRPPPPPPPAADTAFDPPPPGLRLPRHFTPTRYTARLAIDPAKPTFEGEIAIDGQLAKRSAMIWLHGKHLDVTKATATDGTHEVALKVTAQGELLGLRPARPLAEGAWTLKLTYKGSVGQNAFAGAFVTKWGDTPFLSTEFESTAARLVFPCFDEPDRKAPWQLTLDVPKDQVAVSNTVVSGSVALDPQHVRIAFAPTLPIASYLLAFAVGPYDVIDAGKSKSGVPIHVYVPRGEEKHGAYAASVEPKILDLLEAWFGIPYPYGKLDLVAVPSNHGLAMENVGMITADSRYMLFDHPSPLDQYRTVSLFGHETAHQWFGDLVTAAWWDDIWLNESFATWIEDKILVGFDPKWPTESIDHRTAAFDADSLASARKIHQPIETEEDIHNAFDGITYPKGALVLRMIEHEIGEAKFQTAIRHYIGAHANGNATAADIFSELDEAAGKSLGAITQGFFDQAGLPEVAMDLTCDGGGKSVIALAQKRFTVLAGAAADQHWTVPVCVAYEGPKHERVESCTTLAHDTAEIALDVCPTWFAPASDVNYYRAKLSNQALEAIREHAWPKLRPEERIAIYTDAYAYAQLGQIPITTVAAFAEKLRTGKDGLEIAVGLGDGYPLGYGFNTGLPRLLLQVVPTDLLPAAQAKIRAGTEPIAARLGVDPRPTDDYGASLDRVDALNALRWGHSHVVDRDAKRLVGHYATLPHESQSAILHLAIAADAKLADKLYAEMLAQPARELRDTLLQAYADLEDTARHRAFLDRILADPKAGAEDLVRALTGQSEAARADTEAFVRAHVDELMKRLPVGENDDFPQQFVLVFPFVAACDPARRDELVSYIHAHFDVIPNSKRPLAQFIEELDQCIAHKKALEPALRLWLGGKSR